MEFQLPEDLEEARARFNASGLALSTILEREIIKIANEVAPLSAPLASQNPQDSVALDIMALFFRLTEADPPLPLHAMTHSIEWMVGLVLGEPPSEDMVGAAVAVWHLMREMATTSTRLHDSDRARVIDAIMCLLTGALIHKEVFAHRQDASVERSVSLAREVIDVLSKGEHQWLDGVGRAISPS